MVFHIPILASINSMETTDVDNGTKYEDALEAEQQALQEAMERELAKDTKEHKNKVHLSPERVDDEAADPPLPVPRATAI